MHYEIIGQVPERNGRKSRCARGRPTSPAQAFYNAKKSWQQLELLLAANFGAEDFVVTLTFSDGKVPKGREGLQKAKDAFLRKLRAARRLRGDDVKCIAVPEGQHGGETATRFGADGSLENHRPHLHMVINATGPGDVEDFISLWHGGGYVRAERLDIHYYKELARYLTKEAREFGKPKPGEHTWWATKNLEKPEIEYVTISTDSVTLYPPSNALDYSQFAETNPYGFAPCIGARYLLIPKAPPPQNLI